MCRRKYEDKHPGRNVHKEAREEFGETCIDPCLGMWGSGGAVVCNTGGGAVVCNTGGGAVLVVVQY